MSIESLFNFFHFLNYYCNNEEFINPTRASWSLCPDTVRLTSDGSSTHVTTIACVDELRADRSETSSYAIGHMTRIPTGYIPCIMKQYIKSFVCR